MIETVFGKGRSFVHFPFRIGYLFYDKEAPGEDTEEGSVKAGFSASSRNFKKAVDRNRIRRLMKEAYRYRRHELEEAISKHNIKLALFIIYTSKEIPDLPLIEEAIGTVTNKLLKIIHEKAASNS